jgi:hypothetical protein
MSQELWIPKHLRPAVQRTKIVFYKWNKAGVIRYTVGAPENFPAPKGAEKIVCQSAAEVEKYSQILRDQDAADAEISEAERYETRGTYLAGFDEKTCRTRWRTRRTRLTESSAVWRYSGWTKPK